MVPRVSDAAGLSVVVLGGTGALGGAVRCAFEAAGARVPAVPRREPEPGEAVAWAGLDGARAPSGQLAAVLAGTDADIVVNAAGLTHGGTEDLPPAPVSAYGRTGWLEGRWDFVDIRDVAAEALAAATAPRASGQAVNVGCGQALSVRRPAGAGAPGRAAVARP